jgi:two-component system, NarL family, nitrate/nitrite response regulator NarL
MKTYEVLIADDSDRARKAVRMILDSDERFQVVAEATHGEEAIQKAHACMPDLVLMDIHMPGINGFEATKVIKQELPYIRVVMLSVSDNAADLFEAIRHGAQGYLMKSLQPDDWLTYLHGILDGDTPLSRKMATRLLSEFQGTSSLEPKQTPSTQGAKLTGREQEILEHVSTGATNREIAGRLFISENTVKNHLKNIMAKLHFQNRVQLATYSKEIRPSQGRGGFENR